jgi:hypothetical protein
VEREWGEVELKRKKKKGILHPAYIPASKALMFARSIQFLSMKKKRKSALNLTTPEPCQAAWPIATVQPCTKLPPDCSVIRSELGQAVCVDAHG